MRFLSLLLLPSFSLALKDSDLGWWKNETQANYLQWPDSVQPRLASEFNIYKEDSFPLPTVRVFQTFPENITKPLPWALLKSINTRLHPVLWPRVHYEVEEGIEFGCRTSNPNDGTSLPVSSAHCHRHCIHQGRYCLNHYDTGGQEIHGSTLLKEVIRRQCTDTVYQAKDPRFIRYLHEFQQQNCLLEDSMRACSLTALSKVGLKWSQLETCVAEPLLDKDLPHEILDDTLRQLNKRHIGASALPKIVVDGNPIGKNRLGTATVFQEYCQAFPSFVQQPLACHVCKDCGNVRECLWTLQCDGEPFEAGNVHADVLGATQEDMGQYETKAPTQPPKEEEDNGDVLEVLKEDDLEALEEEKEEMEDELDTHTYAPDVLNDSDGEKAGDELQKSQLEQQQQPEDEEGEGHGGVLFWILFLFMTAMACVAFGLYYHQRFRHERAAKLLADIAGGKYTNGMSGLYRDNPEDAVQDLSQSLGGRQADDVDLSERDYRGKAQRLLNAINEGSFRSNSNKDLLNTLPDIPPAQDLAIGVFKDEGGRVQVEDVILDEESEWANQNRGGGIVSENVLLVESSSLV